MNLVVMRHARAVPVDPPLPDLLRPLDARGHLEAREVGSALAAWGVMPDRVLSSDARRTRETWEWMEGAFGRPIRVDYLHAFYSNGADAALDALSRVDSHTVLVLGHNPEWERLVTALTGARVPMSTASAAILDIQMPTWAAAVEQHGKWRLMDVLRPN